MIRPNNKFCAWVLAFAATSVLCGCSPHWMDEAGLRDETVYPATFPIDNPPPPKTNGSIYQAGHEISLYQDHVPGRIGDILTVRLEESTQGEKKAKMKTNKKTANTFTLPSIEKGHIYGRDVSLDSDMQFDGDGESNQQNKLHGTISVTVTRVLSNGNLVVQGESWLTINQGREYIRLTGIVRREDIDASNTVSSQRLADARISYSGTGQVSNAARGGIITQFLFKFFPY
ncbi:Flagellar L-ring protein [Aquicella siphonis]|uniref:Flagellar L-ring protein n=1 Tax=Aquicella siphonis TaxID=254247 RepID=A0A5E4PL18_9COXI|nr:flagellar basal body L-ring protein FlgH [Aquicella siphonis]VVC77101.1 Flagellar L-ring protein [Aquicella siphonis]